MSGSPRRKPHDHRDPPLPGPHRSPARAGDQHRSADREVRQGRRARRRRRAPPRGPRARRGRSRRTARAAGKRASSSAQRERLRSGRAHQLRRRHRPAGHADQLLRAAGGRLDRRGRRRPPRHLHRAAPKPPRRCAAAAASATTSRASGRRGAWVDGTRSQRLAARCPTCACSTARCETVESAGARRGAQMGVLRCDHPDIEEFIHAKDQRRPDQLQHLGRRDRCLHAGGARTTATVELVHRAEPGAAQKAAGAYQRDDGLWVYRKLPARELWDQIMRSTYDHAEPGILFLDRINRDNNLSYCETIEATNPCAEQPLPPYGCCCLGSIDLTRFVREPFEPTRALRLRRLRRGGAQSPCACSTTCSTSPSGRCRSSTRKRMAKRRIGLGFTGLGDALVMLRPALRQRRGARHGGAHRRGACATRPTRPRSTWRASAAPSRSSTPTCYLSARHLRLAPAGGAEGAHPHSTACATPTCCRSRPPAPSAWPSPTTPATASSRRSRWTYTRKKRMADGSFKEYAVEDHAWRLYRHLQRHRRAKLPRAFVTALEISRASAHADDGGGGGAVHRHLDLEDRQRAGGLSLRRLPGPVPEPGERA